MPSCFDWDCSIVPSYILAVFLALVDDKAKSVSHMRSVREDTAGNYSHQEEHVRQSADSSNLVANTVPSNPSTALHISNNNASAASVGRDSRSSYPSELLEDFVQTADPASSSTTSAPVGTPGSDLQKIRKGRFIVENVDPVIEPSNVAFTSSAQLSISEGPEGAHGSSFGSASVTMSNEVTASQPGEDRSLHQHQHPSEGEAIQSTATAALTSTGVPDQKTVTAASALLEVNSRTPSPTIIISAARLVGTGSAAAVAGGTIVDGQTAAVASPLPSSACGVSNSVPALTDDKAVSTSNFNPSSVHSQPANPHPTVASVATSENGPEVTKKGRFVVINAQAPVITSPIGLVSGPKGVSPVVVNPPTTFSGTAGVIAATNPVSAATPVAGATNPSISSSVNAHEHKEHEIAQDVNRNEAVATDKAVVGKARLEAVQLQHHAHEASKTDVTNPNAAATTIVNSTIGSQSSFVPVSKPESAVQSSNVPTSHVRSASARATSAPSNVCERAAFSSFEMKRGHGLGKVYHFLEEIKLEVQEVDKLNRALQNDMKFFVSVSVVSIQF